METGVPPRGGERLGAATMKLVKMGFGRNNITCSHGPLGKNKRIPRATGESNSLRWEKTTCCQNKRAKGGVTEATKGRKSHTANAEAAKKIARQNLMKVLRVKKILLSENGGQRYHWKETQQNT